MDLENLDEEVEEGFRESRGYTKFGMGSARSAQTYILCHTTPAFFHFGALGSGCRGEASCTEFAEQQGIRVDFADENIPLRCSG